MIQVLTILQFSLLLLFGIALSMSFADIEFNKKNIILLFLFFMILGSLQLLLYTFFDELTVRKLYPIITHFPLIVILILYYKKRISTAIAATTSAYICCQPARWAGLFIYILTGFEIIQIITTILVYLFFGLFVIFYVSKSIAKIFMKDEKSVYIFGIIPMVYYLFDYTMNIYLIEDAFIASISSEFLPFFLCLVYLLFCTLYYKEHEQKLEMEQKEKLINFNIEQQAKEIEVLKRSEKEMRVIRHDLRLLLNNLSISIQQNDK